MEKSESPCLRSLSPRLSLSQVCSIVFLKHFIFHSGNQLRIEYEQWLRISFAFVKLCHNRKVILTEFICLGISFLL